MIMKLENSEETFHTSLSLWEDAILAYSNASRSKTIGLKHALRDWDLSTESHSASESDEIEGLSLCGYSWFVIVIPSLTSLLDLHVCTSTAKLFFFFSFFFKGLAHAHAKIMVRSASRAQTSFT